MFATLWGAMAVLTSCAYGMHQVQVSSFSPYAPLEKGGEIIKASGEQFVVMGFVTDTEYVDKAYQTLQSRCPQGDISAVTTQFYTQLGFFSWTNKIMLQGVCRSSGS